jgi:hypothetical protein
MEGFLEELKPGGMGKVQTGVALSSPCLQLSCEKTLL